jgi:hypothetical protein
MTWNGKRWRVPAAVFAGIVVVNLVYPCMWFADSTTGTVVDAHTRRPVANAVVTVTWLLDGLEGFPVGWLESRETTTNEQGEFEVPGFLMRFRFGHGRLSHSEPNIRILAKGYEPFRDRGAFGMTSVRLYAGASFDGNTFGLQPRGTAGCAEAFRFFDEDFDFVNAITRESTRRFPQTMKLLQVMRAEGCN